MKKCIFIFNFLILALFLLLSCSSKNEVISPKPKGYFRIYLPQSGYHVLDTVLPFTMEISDYAEASITKKDSGKIWVDLVYPKLSAEIKMSYFPIHENLRERMIQERKMVEFHYIMADDVEYSIINDPDSKMFGQIYDIAGDDVATPFQFWVCDSSEHFLRGSLYFNFPPDNDSIQPVIDYLRDDLLQLVNTLQWK